MLSRLLVALAAVLMLPGLAAVPTAHAMFQLPAAGNHAWPYWGAQLQALKPDLIATLNG